MSTLAGCFLVAGVAAGAVHFDDATVQLAAVHALDGLAAVLALHEGDEPEPAVGVSAVGASARVCVVCGRVRALQVGNGGVGEEQQSVRPFVCVSGGIMC